MVRTMFLILAAVLLGCSCHLQKCDVGMVGGTKQAIDVLNKLSPDGMDRDSQQCIDAAISMAAQMRSKEAIRELVHYRSFKKEVPPEPKQEGDIGFHRHAVETEYPAVVALGLIGSVARPALLDIVESRTGSAMTGCTTI